MSGRKANLDDFSDIFDKVATNEGLRNYKVVDGNTTNKGDGYLGLISFVELVGEERTLHLVIKSAPVEEAARKTIDTRQVFLTEQNIYWKALRKFAELEREHNIKNPFNSVPKCYAIRDENLREAIVFENLRKSGFQLKNREEPMNAHHLELVLKEYGKFHALSFAFKRISPSIYKQIREELSNNVFCDVLEQIDKRSMARISNDIVTHLKENNKNDVAEAFGKFAASAIKKIIEDRRKEDDDEYSVLTHGDCWGNNFMFKYENDQLDVPSAVKILDWQCSTFGCPTADLGYYFWAGAAPENYANHMRFLKIYHDALAQHLQQFGLDSNECFPFKELEKRWKTNGMRYGTLMATMVFKAMLVKPDEAPDFSQEQEEGSENDIFYFKITRMDDYLKRCEELIEFMYKNGHLDK